MNRNLLIVLAFVAISCSGCKQTAYTPPPPAKADSYFPQTYGSTWQYRDSVFGLPTDTIPIKGVKNDTLTYTIDGATTDFNNLICYNARVISQNRGAGTSYFYAGKHMYALLDSSPPWGLTVMQVLVDTASVGYTWYSTPTLYSVLNGSPVRAFNTILGKNLKKVVGGHTFTNVTHTGTNFQINVNGDGFHNAAYFDFYMVQGIGLIEKDAYYYGFLNETETIVNYAIK